MPENYINPIITSAICKRAAKQVQEQREVEAMKNYFAARPGLLKSLRAWPPHRKLSPGMFDGETALADAKRRGNLNET